MQNTDCNRKKQSLFTHLPNMKAVSITPCVYLLFSLISHLSTMITFFLITRFLSNHVLLTKVNEIINKKGKYRKNSGQRGLLWLFTSLSFAGSFKRDNLGSVQDALRKLRSNSGARNAVLNGNHVTKLMRIRGYSKQKQTNPDIAILIVYFPNISFSFFFNDSLMYYYYH